MTPEFRFLTATLHWSFLVVLKIIIDISLVCVEADLWEICILIPDELWLDLYCIPDYVVKEGFFFKPQWAAPGNSRVRDWGVYGGISSGEEDGGIPS